MSEDKRTLAEKIGVPEGTMLEWSPIISLLSQSHKKPVSEPIYDVLSTTRINATHGVPAPPMEFKMGEIMSQNCGFKAFTSGVVGYGLGSVIGIFMYSTRTNAIEAQFSSAAGAGADLSRTEWRGWRAELKDIGRECHRTGRNFGIIGSCFLGTECAISTVRGKEDIKTPVLAGFIVGAAGGMRAGFGPALMGGGGFAIFSYAIEQFIGRY